VVEVLDGLGLPPEVCHLVLVNGNFVAPGERKTTKLAEGDHLAVWPPVAGGGGKKKPAGGNLKSKTVEKEMAVTHADFFRTLPKALGTNGFKRSGDKVVLEDGEKRLEIALGPERERKIANLAVPATDVTLTFSGYTDAEASDALKLFDRMFQKGGG
jgi:sulfur carrier protein ThiS